MPTITLSQYKKEAKDVGKNDTQKIEAVTDKDVDTFIEEIRNNIEKQGSPKPEVNDEFAKKVAPVQNLKELKEKLSVNLQSDRELKLRQERRQKLVDTLLNKSSIEIPEVLIDEELERMFSQFEGELSRSNLTLDSYLKTIGKKRTDLNKEWRTNAERNVKTELMLMEIAKQENIKPDNERVEHEVKNLQQMHEGVPEDRIRSHVTGALIIESTIRFLEHEAGFLGDKTINEDKGTTKTDEPKKDEDTK